LAIKWREAEHQIAQLQADLAVARQQIAEYRDVVIPAMDRTISHQVERASRAESYLAEARRESDHHRDVMNNNARIAHRLDAENARLKEALEAMLIHHGHHGCQPLFGQCAHTTARALLAQEEK
jgi:ribosomal protein RSM22 (predicted rRNA methylase)